MSGPPAKQSTALIESPGGWGTGFVIAPGLVMTNAHVLTQRPAGEYAVSFVSLDDTAPPKLKPALVYFDARRDLAVLRVKTDRPALDVTPPGTDLGGMEVAVVGNPKGDANQADVNKVTVGKLSAPVRRDAGWTYYELSAPAYFGNSGGPVIDRKTGKLVGVMQSILGDGKAKSYCIPYGEALRAVAALGGPNQERAATRVAEARQGLDLIAARLKDLEAKAQLGMVAQRVRLLEKRHDLQFLIRLDDGTTVLVADLLAALTELQRESYPAVAKAAAAVERAGMEVPAGLRTCVSLRLEMYGKMFALATASTRTDESFKREVEERRAASEAAVKSFDKAHAAYLDGLDAKRAGGR